MPRAKILVIDHDPVWAQLLADLLMHDDHEVFSSGSAQESLLLLQSKDFDGVVAEINFPGADGNAFVEQLRQIRPAVALIVHTGQPAVAQAVLATKIGAADYLAKSRDVAMLDALRAKVTEAVRTRPGALRPAAGTAGTTVEPGEAFHGMTSRNPQMHDIFELIQTIADSYANVLIHGETGTGKELVARAIHDASGRHAKPFVTVDCSTLARELLESELFGHEKGAFTGATERHIGRFERANHGTLFLDEVANIGLPVQAKLLRVLQTRTFERVGG